MAPRPTLDEVRAWIDVSDFDLSDDQLALICQAEAALQAQFCRWGRRRQAGWPDSGEPVNDAFTGGGDLPDPLAQAFLRRCARAVAARGLPLGTLPVPMTGAGGEYGAALLPRLDAEVERYEAAYRVIAVA